MRAIAKAMLKLSTGASWLSPTPKMVDHSEVVNGVTCMAFEAVATSKCDEGFPLFRIYNGQKKVTITCNDETLEVGCSCPSTGHFETKMALYMPPSLTPHCVAQHVKFAAAMRQEASLEAEKYFPCAAEVQKKCDGIELPPAPPPAEPKEVPGGLCEIYVGMCIMVPVFSKPELMGTRVRYIGCKNDCLGGRDLPTPKGKCTMVECASRCFGYRYFGLQKGNKPGFGACHCGMLPGKQGDAAGCQCVAARNDSSALLKCKNCE